MALLAHHPWGSRVGLVHGMRRLMEHLHTNWDSWHLRHWVGKWLHRKVEPLRAGRPSLADWEQSPPPTSASEPVLDAAAAAGDEVRGAAEHVTDGAGLPQPGSDPVVDTPFEADMWYDEAPAILRQWQGGVVDMHIMNTLAVPVEVFLISIRSRWGGLCATSPIVHLCVGVPSMYVGTKHGCGACAFICTRRDAVLIAAPSAMPWPIFSARV